MREVSRDPVLASITARVIARMLTSCDGSAMDPSHATVGDLLREWRRRRRYSQLGLALEAEISQRHLSFVESGRSAPSRDLLLRLMRPLDMPPRARNGLLRAAGFAPLYAERPLAAPEMAAARAAVERLLAGHEPHPALAVDRYWTLVAANRAVAVLTAGVAPHLLQGEVNVLHLSLHPDGLAPRLLNYAEWRAHILARLAHDVAASGDDRLAELLEALRAYPPPAGAPGPAAHSASPERIAVPLRLRSAEGPLDFLSTTTVFGTAVDLTLADLAIESFFPANAETAAAMLRLMAG